MSQAAGVASKNSRRRVTAFLGYIVCVGGLILVAGVAVGDLYERMVAVASAADLLDHMEGRRMPPGQGAPASDALAPGSAFLEGRTVTVAGAALQQRVDAAVKKVGGDVLSSQIELQGPLSKDGFVSLSANFEIDQPALQQLLYDLEAGTPFLFVDTLSVQAPQALGELESVRMRVSIGVSGQWQGTK